MAGEASDQMVKDDKPSCARREVPSVNGSYVFCEPQGLEVTKIVDNGASDTIVNPQVYKRTPKDVQMKLFQAGHMIKGTGGETIKIWG